MQFAREDMTGETSFMEIFHKTLFSVFYLSRTVVSFSNYFSDENIASLCYFPRKQFCGNISSVIRIGPEICQLIVFGDVGIDIYVWYLFFIEAGREFGYRV